MPWIAGILCWVALSLGTSLAYCQSSPEDPEVLIRTGNDLRRKGDDKRAEGYLRRAYELAHTPRAAVQLGLVELALGLYQDSDKHLTEALNSRDLWVSDHRSVIDEGRINARRHLMAVEIVGAAPESTATLPDGSVLPLPSAGGHRSDGAVQRRRNPGGADGTCGRAVSAIGHARA